MSPAEQLSCVCEYRLNCGGLGLLDCLGCGGDLCVCRCGGEMECHGCEDCSDFTDEGGEE